MTHAPASRVPSRPAQPNGRCGAGWRERGHLAPVVPACAAGSRAPDFPPWRTPPSCSLRVLERRHATRQETPGIRAVAIAPGVDRPAHILRTPSTPPRCQRPRSGSLDNSVHRHPRARPLLGPTTPPRAPPWLSGPGAPLNSPSPSPLCPLDFLWTALLCAHGGDRRRMQCAPMGERHGPGSADQQAPRPQTPSAGVGVSGALPQEAAWPSASRASARG